MATKRPPIVQGVPKPELDSAPEAPSDTVMTVGYGSPQLLPLQDSQDEPVIEKMYPFNGQWMGGMKGVDGIQIGPENYQTLENMRYTDGGGLEGVHGYTDYNTANPINATYIEPRSLFQLRTDYTIGSYVLVQCENAGETASLVYQNQTAITSAGQGDFTATAIHTDATGAGLGRFADFPGGNMAYCNGVESCVWAGEEMRCAAVFTLWQVATSRDDIALNDNGASADTIVTTNGNFTSYGFKAGQVITISGANTAGNNKDVTAVSISTDGKTISLATGTLAGTDAAGATTVTLTVAAETEYGNPIDCTEAANNSLTTVGNVIPIGTGVDSYTVLMLHADDQADESTTITDSSASGHTVTANGNTQIDTSQVKFGKGSIQFANAMYSSADYLSVPNHADWYMGSGTFTIDFWANGTGGGIFEQYTGVDDYVQCAYTSPFGSLEWIFKVRSGGVDRCDIALSGEYPFFGYGWNHVAIIRGWGGNANTVALCRNGVALGTGTFTGEWPDLAEFLIGRATVISTGFNGVFDEFRVSKGVARWTANFSPPTRAYDATQHRWLACSTRPLKGVTYDVSEANAVASSTTCKVWTGREFTATAVTDGTRPAAISLAQDGSMTFTSTVNIAKPFYFEGLYLYAYLFELSAGSAEIKQITLNADFQNMVDVWDGVLRQPIAFEYWKDADGRYEDYTIQVNMLSEEYYPMGAVINAMTSSDHIKIMFDERQACLNIGMMGGMTNVADATITLEHWNGYEYVEDDLLLNETSPSHLQKAFSQTGTIAWYPPSHYEEVVKTEFGVTGFSYRIKIVGGPLTDLGSDGDVTIETVTGIPAQGIVPPFKFPTQFRGRPMLCNYTNGNEKNRVDYGLTSASDVWNGYETSMFGLQSLYIGGNEGLVAAGQLYNRFGANIFATLIFLKRFETYLLTGSGPDDYRYFPISLNVGCAAPLTLSFAEMGFEMADQVVRNIAVWLSHSGPVIFDGAVLAPLHGVNKFFDVVDSEYVNTSYIDRSWAVYDPGKFIWHLCIPTAAATDCDKWLSFDFIRRKWYETVPAAYPQCACVARDTKGMPYILGGLNTGYIEKLDKGKTWDGTAIAQKVRTGSFFPTDNQWDTSGLRHLKLIAKKISEDTDTRIIHFSDTVAAAPSGTFSDLTFADNDPNADTILTLGCAQAEMVVNGAFAADTDWTKDAEWTIAGGVASFDDTGTGYITPTTAVALTVGTTYVFTFTISNLGGATGASIRFADETGTVLESGQDYVLYAAGTHSLEVTVTEANTNWRLYSDTAGDSYDIDELSLGEKGSTFLESGVRQQQEITFTGTASNNTAFIVDSISSDGKTLTVSGNGVTNEGPIADGTWAVTADVIVPLDSGSNRTTRTTKPVNINSWSHSLEFSTSTSTTDKGAQLLAWGYRALKGRKDL